MKNSKLREKDVEARLVRKTKDKLGGIAAKYTSPGRRSVPDRMLLWIYRNIAFVECKAPGQTWTKAQARERDKLIALGHTVLLADSYERVDEIIEILELL